MQPNRKWTIDSGAQVSVCNDVSILNDDVRNTSLTVRVANNQVMHPEKVGSATIKLNDTKGNPVRLHLSRVLYSPQFSSNLLSLRELVKDNNLSLEVDSNRAVLKKNRRTIPLTKDFDTLSVNALLQST